MINIRLFNHLDLLVFFGTRGKIQDKEFLNYQCEEDGDSYLFAIFDQYSVGYYV